MKVILSGNLRRFTNFEGEVLLDARTITEALDLLLAQYPDLKPILYDGGGRTRAVHRLYLNGEVVDPGGTDHNLNSTDELGILTAIAGG